MCYAIAVLLVMYPLEPLLGYPPEHVIVEVFERDLAVLVRVELHDGVHSVVNLLRETVLAHNRVLHLNQLRLENLPHTVTSHHAFLQLVDVELLKFCQNIQLASFLKNAHCPELLERDREII